MKITTPAGIIECTVDDALRYAKLKHGLYLIKEKGKWTLIAK